VLTLGLTFQENRQAWSDMVTIDSVTLSHIAMNKTFLQPSTHCSYRQSLYKLSKRQELNVKII
jgi:hypothetical protein